MRDEHVIDHRQFGQRKIGDASPGIDQDVMVDQHRGGTQMTPADATATAEDSDLHRVSTCDIRWIISSSGKIPS